MPHLQAVGQWLSGIYASPHAAPWVQAIGAIVAVLAAFMIANGQKRRDDRLKARDRLEALALPLQIADATIQLLEREIARFATYTSENIPADPSLPPEVTWLLGNVQHLNVTRVSDGAMLMLCLRLASALHDMDKSYLAYMKGLEWVPDESGVGGRNVPWMVRELGEVQSKVEAIRKMMHARLADLRKGFR